MRFHGHLRVATFVLGGALFHAAPSAAASIYVDLGAYSGAPSNLFGAAAGTPGVWNNVGVLGTVSDLLDTLGHVTSADITVSADSPEGTGGPASTDATRLMHDNIYSVPGSTWSVSLSGLANGLYDVYLYDPMNMFLGTGSGSVNGVTFASINGNFAGTFTRGANYLLLTEIVVANGLLSASGGEAGALAGLAGLQLVEKKVTPEAVPEPGTLMLLGAAFTCLGVGSRRKISGSRRSAYPRK